MNRELVLESFINNKELLDKRNSEGIEKYRKGNFTLKFDNVCDKTVTIRQKKHKFLFGCTAFMLNSFEKQEKEAIFKERFANLFNQAVVPFYWSDLEPTEGKVRFRKDSENIYRRPAPDIVLEFCKEYGIEPKGHCLTWNGFVPAWLSKYSPEERKKILERRFKEIADEYADKIPSFDIVNESASNYNRGRKVLFENYDEFGLSLGGKYFPNNIKILNETNEAIWTNYTTEGKYIAFNMQLKEFIAKKLPIDEIGLQYHIFRRSEEMENDIDVRKAFLNVPSMLEILDIFDAYGFPMHISEITIPGSGQKEENEEVQAYLVKQLYKTWFATRNMKSIVWWNMVDGYAAYAPLGTTEGENRCGGGIMRFDMSEKPAYKVLDRLINKEWKTNIEVKVTDNEYKFRGFYGDYEIVVKDESGERVIDAKLYENNECVEI
ncbi:MAG: endo-1,4-beta-xylanase [Clostridia bacterium]|nr:endo-1,4-beta-xylanase [Clostridia bacterium]